MLSYTLFALTPAGHAKSQEARAAFGKRCRLTSTQISAPATQNTRCHPLSDSSVSPLVFSFPPTLILFSPLLFTCTINSSACLSSTTSVSPRMSSRGKSGRPEHQRSLLFTPLPWERLSLAGPEHPPPSIMQQTPCRAEMQQSQGPALQPGSTC